LIAEAGTTSSAFCIQFSSQKGWRTKHALGDGGKRSRRAGPTATAKTSLDGRLGQRAFDNRLQMWFHYIASTGHRGCKNHGQLQTNYYRKNMKLRFEVDQAEAFRQGIDVPKSIVTIEVNPAEISQEQRNLIADRLDGIDVCQHAGVLDDLLDGKPKRDRDGKPFRIMAKLPTFESLMEAVTEDEKDAQISSKKKVDEFKAEKSAKEESCEVLLNKYLGTPN
jgi:hypothetical protein